MEALEKRVGEAEAEGGAADARGKEVEASYNQYTSRIDLLCRQAGVPDDDRLGTWVRR